jgi:hypothetical protein
MAEVCICSFFLVARETLVHKVLTMMVSVAWGVRNTCKHNGVVFLPVAAPLGRGADGVDAMS